MRKVIGMTDINIDSAVDPLEAIVEPSGDALHWVCCRDNVTALCRVEIENFEEPNDNDYDCDICDVLAEAAFCPNGYTCPTN